MVIQNPTWNVAESRTGRKFRGMFHSQKQSQLSVRCAKNTPKINMNHLLLRHTLFQSLIYQAKEFYDIQHLNHCRQKVWLSARFSATMVNFRKLFIAPQASTDNDVGHEVSRISEWLFTCMVSRASCRLYNSSDVHLSVSVTFLQWHISAITCQIIISTCQIFMLTFHLFICQKINLKKLFLPNYCHTDNKTI